MGRIKNIRPRKIKVQPGTIGNLYAQESTSSWKAPESLPVLDDRYKRVWFDSEWNGTDWAGNSQPIGYSICLEDDRRYYLPFGHRGGGNLDPGLVRRWAQRELRDKVVVLASGKGDIQMARKAGLDFEAQGCRLEDIQHKAALLSDQRRSFKLDDLAFDFLGKRKLDLDRSRIWELPASEVGPYAEEDAYLTKCVDEVTDPLIEREDLSRVLRLENDLLYCTCEMERNGVPLDLPKLFGWKNQIEHRYAQTILQVASTSGIKVNPDSGADLARLAHKYEIPYPFTETGQPSFTDAFLRTIPHPDFASLREARAIWSLRNKYLLPYSLKQRNGVLRYQLHQLKGDEYGTISGRYSSSNVNIQQVFKPSRQFKKLGFDGYIIRELFIPYLPDENPEDWVWIKADAAQIEFRLFVHYSASERLIAKYRENPEIDFHNVVQELLRRAREIDRDDTKDINFGKLYAMGRAKMARQMGIDQESANELFDLYDEMFPEAKDLLNLTMKLARERGWIKTIMGRRARFPNADRIHKALNRVLQGSAADIMKIKLLEVYNNRNLLNLRMFFTVHDEVDGRVPRGGNYAKMFHELLNTQIERLKLRVPILWETKTGPHWAACK